MLKCISYNKHSKLTFSRRELWFLFLGFILWFYLFSNPTSVTAFELNIYCPSHQPYTAYCINPPDLSKMNFLTWREEEREAQQAEEHLHIAGVIVCSTSEPPLSAVRPGVAQPGVCVCVCAEPQQFHPLPPWLKTESVSLMSWHVCECVCGKDVLDLSLVSQILVLYLSAVNLSHWIACCVKAAVIWNPVCVCWGHKNYVTCDTCQVVLQNVLEGRWLSLL